MINKDQIIEINQVIVQLIKLRQIASGFIYGPNGTVKYLKCPKLDLLIELITSPEYFKNKSKIVIWCSFIESIRRLSIKLEKLNIKHVTFCGESPDKKLQSRISFRDDPMIRIFIGQSDSGLGMNELICADTAMYYDNSHKLISRIQSEGRIRRRGSEKLHKIITYCDLLSENSIDISILKSIKNNRSISDFVLAEIRSGKNLRNILQK
jgi:SNF2 family DNA or RNA helicase